MRILIVKETRPKEVRVAMVPSDVVRLIKKGHNVWVEHLAGVGCGYTDKDYIKIGAEIIDFETQRETFQKSQFQEPFIILRVKRAIREREIWENQMYNENICMIGFLDPLKQPDTHIKEWIEIGLTSLSLELSRLDRDDPKNVSAAMSRLAGSLAFEAALNNYTNPFPPSVIILGTGPAAINAAKRAQQERYEVTVFGRNEKYRPQLEHEGLRYIMFPQSDTKSQARFLDDFLSSPCIIITAARFAGEKAPILIDCQSTSKMQAGSSIVDLSGEGGNVEESQYDTTLTTHNGVIISNCTGYPKIIPKEASEIYSHGLLAFLEDIFSAPSLFDSSSFKSCYVTAHGKRNPLLSSNST